MVGGGHEVEVQDGHMEFYATAAIVGALVWLGLHALGLPKPVQLGAVAVACPALGVHF